MKICDQCGTQNPEAAKFCRGCGQPFAAVPVSSANENAAAHSPTPTSASQPAAAAGIMQTPGEDAGQQSTVPIAQQPVQQPTQPVQPVYGQPLTQGVPQQPAQQPTQPVQPVYGQPMTQGVPQQPAQPVAQSSSNAFFMWLWESFKHPSHKQSVQAWWPIIPLLFNSLLMGLTVYMWQSKAMSAASNFGNSILGSLSDLAGSSYTSHINASVSISEFFKSWILFAVLFYLTVLMCFMGIKMLGDRNTTFAMLHVELAQKLIPMVALNLVSLLFALIGSGLTALSVSLFFVGYIYVLAVPGAIIAQATNYRKMDKTWAWILIMLLCGFIMSVFFMVVVATGLMSVVSSLSSLL